MKRIFCAGMESSKRQGAQARVDCLTQETRPRAEDASRVPRRADPMRPCRGFAKRINSGRAEAGGVVLVRFNAPDEGPCSPQVVPRGAPWAKI